MRPCGCSEVGFGCRSERDGTLTRSTPVVPNRVSTWWFVCRKGGGRVGGVGEGFRAAERQACNSDLPPLTSRFVACMWGGLMFSLAAGWHERAAGSRVAGSAMCGCSAVGSASPCQGEGRGFESRHPLEGQPGPGWRCGRVVRQRPAKPCTRVRFPSPPLKKANHARLAQRESASLTRKRSLVQSQYRARRRTAGQPLFQGLLICFFRVRNPTVCQAFSLSIPGGSNRADPAARRFSGCARCRCAPSLRGRGGARRRLWMGRGRASVTSRGCGAVIGHLLYRFGCRGGSSRWPRGRVRARSGEGPAISGLMAR